MVGGETKEAWMAQLSAHYRAGREADWAIDDARYALQAAQVEVRALQREWERAKTRQHVCQQELDGFMDHCWSRLPTERVETRSVRNGRVQHRRARRPGERAAQCESAHRS